MARPGLSWCAGMAALSLCAVAGAQRGMIDDLAGGTGGDGGSGATLLGATRVVASWDFESEEDRLFGIPAGWFRSVHDQEGEDPTFRPGFPPFNLAQVSEVVGGAGGYAIEAPTKGGSASLMLARGRLVAMPGSDYMVTARVRTSGLEHAAARVGIRFVDGQLNPIEGAGEMSAPVRSEGGWATVRVPIEGHDEAAFIQLELQLVQPEVLEPEALRAHEVRGEDFDGSAWFDDVVVYQVPRIDFHAAGAQNVVVSPDEPELTLRVQDFTGERLVAEASVYDARGGLVDARRMVDGGATGAGSSSTVSWRPELPGFGWYRAVVRLKNESGIVGQRACDLVWLARGPEGDAEDRAMFGVALGEASELGAADEVIGLLEELKTGSVWLGVWAQPDGGGVNELDEEAGARFRRLVEGLINRRDRLHLALSAAPRDLAESARTEPGDVLGVIDHDPSAAISGLRELLQRYAERATSWHIGAVGSDDVSSLRDAPSMIARVLEAMGEVAPRPVVSVPWRAQGEVRALGSDVASPTVRVDAWASGDSVREIVEGWRRVGVTPSLVFTPLDEDRFGTEACVRRLVRLAVSGWEAGVGWSPDGGGSLVVERPWRRAIDGRGGAMPTAWYGAWRTLSEELAGRRPVAELYAGEGARAIVAVGSTEEDGAIVAWNEWGRGGDAELRALLGFGAVTVRDHNGNERTVEAVGGEHVIELTDTPVFISGIDTRLVRFRAGLKLVPRFMESRAQRHAMEIEIFNPYRESVQAAVRFASPEGWDFAPRVVRTTIAGGDTVRVPVEVAIGVGETSGVRRVMTEVALTTAGGEQPIQLVPMQVELGMEDLRVSPSYRYITGDDGAVTGVVVSLLIANIGEREVPLNAFAFAPGQAAREVLIPSLAPGQAIVRRFVFEGAGDLVGRRVRAGVREINGNGRLNYWVELR